MHESDCRLLLPVEDEAKVRFHNKPPPPNSLINPLISSLLLSFCLMTNYPLHHKTSTYLHTDVPVLLQVLVSLSPSLLYLLVSFRPVLYEIYCAPLLSADAAVIEKHTLLRPLSLSPSLTLIGCLLEVTSPFFSACLPPSSSVPSLALSSPQSLWILTIPLLDNPPFFALPSSIYCLCSPLPSCS